MAIVRANFNSYEAGEEYITRLADETDRNFALFLTLLSSYWRTSVDGPMYAREIKAMSIALSKLRLALEDVLVDGQHSVTRPEYLYQTITSVLFPGSSDVPDLQSTDIDFRSFLQKLVEVYFAGSIPSSIKKALELLTGGAVVVREHFSEARQQSSGYDIADTFGMTIDVLLESPDALDVFLADRNIRILLSIIRPGHTLYTVRYILQDAYVGSGSSEGPQKIADVLSAAISNYSYDDFRKFVNGIDGLDPLGFKQPIVVSGEDHSAQF